MKKLAYAVAALSLLAAPLAAFAQSANEPLTRAQVRAQLVEVEQAGYNPGATNDYNYPADIQAAEARIAARKQTQGTDGYGPSTNGSAQSSQ